MKKILMILIFLVIIAISTSVFVHISLDLAYPYKSDSDIYNLEPVIDDVEDKHKVMDLEEPNETIEENNSIERKHIQDCSYICPLKNRVKVIEYTN